jgi:hypothetical protein
MQLPSLSIELLNRVYACSVIPWSEIQKNGDRTERAARHLVALDLVRIERWPDRQLQLTAAGRGELYRRRRWNVG